jgi:hypothetical protein
VPPTLLARADEVIQRNTYLLRSMSLLLGTIRKCRSD